MNKIDELKAQIRKERNIGLSRKEMQDIQEEKEKLQSELIRLRKENKYGAKMQTLSKIGKNLKQLGGQVMGEIGKAQKVQAQKEKQGGLFG